MFPEYIIVWDWSLMINDYSLKFRLHLEKKFRLQLLLFFNIFNITIIKCIFLEYLFEEQWPRVLRILHFWSFLSTLTTSYVIYFQPFQTYAINTALPVQSTLLNSIATHIWQHIWNSYKTYINNLLSYFQNKKKKLCKTFYYFDFTFL